MPETLLEERPQHRRVLVRTALLYLPAGAVATGLFALAFINLVTGHVGAILAVVIMGLIAFAVDFEAIGALRDLRTEPAITEGPILRKWSKGRFAFFGRVHYLMLGRRVFEVSAPSALELRDGDHVRIEHWPHTNTVIRLYRLPGTSAGTGSRSPAP
jgi:hypothetical protein